MGIHTHLPARSPGSADLEPGTFFYLVPVGDACDPGLPLPLHPAPGVLNHRDHRTQTPLLSLAHSPGCGHQTREAEPALSLAALRTLQSPRLPWSCRADSFQEPCIRALQSLFRRSGPGLSLPPSHPGVQAPVPLPNTQESDPSLLPHTQESRLYPSSLTSRGPAPTTLLPNT